VHEIDDVAELAPQLLVAILGGGKVAFLGFLDQRTDPVGALAFRQRAADRVLDFSETVERDSCLLYT
jgi:hypothetical protein